MTYFQSLEEIREWVLLHEKDINTAYDTMVAIKALWNNGYNQAMVDAAVPIGETPRPSGFIAEDAGDLSVATEELREEPPDYSTESRDPPYGITEEEAPALHGPEEVDRAISQLTGQWVEVGELPNEYTPYPELYIGQPLVPGTRYRVGDQVMMHVTPDTINREPRRDESVGIRFMDGSTVYTAEFTNTETPTGYRWMCGPVALTEEMFQRLSVGEPGMMRSVLRALRDLMPLLVVAGNHSQFHDWCRANGYLDEGRSEFPCARHTQDGRMILGYGSREGRTYFIGNFESSPAMSHPEVQRLYTHIIGSSNPDLRSHVEGDGFHSDSERNQSEPYTFHPNDRWMEAAAERLNSDEPSAEATYSGPLAPPLTLEEVEGAMRYLRRYGARELAMPLLHTQSPEAEASQEEALALSGENSPIQHLLEQIDEATCDGSYVTLPNGDRISLSLARWIEDHLPSVQEETRRAFTEDMNELNEQAEEAEEEARPYEEEEDFPDDP